MHRRAFLVGSALASSCAEVRAQTCAPEPTAPIAQLLRAMHARDLPAIQAAVASNTRPGSPRPEAPEDLRPIAQGSPTAPDRAAIIRRYLTNAERVAWWRTQPPPAPTDIPAPLRMPARLICGLLKLAQRVPDVSVRATALATEAGDYLIACSSAARFNGAPFPYWRGRDGRLGALAERAARRLERCGQLQPALRNGWFVIENTPQEYFFDTGLAGEAYVALYRATNAPRFMQAALAAAHWAEAQPLAANWNYNGFIAGFFAELAYISQSIHWRDRAVEWARFGVIPGMIASGPNAGHWVDPHNERMVYRAIMARSLTQVSRAWRDHRGAHSVGSEIERAAQTAITALERQMRAAGGYGAVSGMAELYGEIERAREVGATLAAADTGLRSAILNHLLTNASRDRHAPDNAVADAIQLWYR